MPYVQLDKLSEEDYKTLLDKGFSENQICRHLGISNNLLRNLTKLYGAAHIEQLRLNGQKRRGAGMKEGKRNVNI
jgi:hypothetical protein